MNEVMLRDIQSQPAILSAAIPDLRKQAASIRVGRPTRRIVLTGSGDSYIAAHAVGALFARSLALQVRAIPSLDASRYERWNPGDLLVAISVSGEVSRAIEAALVAGAAGATTLAVTAAAESSLAEASDVRMVIPPPIDRSIPHSRDYTLCLAALGVVLEWLRAGAFPELDRWPDMVEQVLVRVAEDVARIPESDGRTWFLGAGPDRATAMYGALKFWEAAGLRAWWDDLEEFAHGSQLMAEPGDRAIIVAAAGGARRAVEMTAGFTQMGIDSVLITDAPPDPAMPSITVPSLGGAPWQPFVSCLPIQQLTYTAATKRGLDVSVPLDGKPYGPAFDSAHVEWTKHSRVERLEPSGASE